MTLHEISEYYRLWRRLQQNQELLATFREAVLPGAQELTGMPHAPGVRDKIGDLTAEIVDLESDTAEIQLAMRPAKERVERYIGTIPDTQTRMIFRLRFLHGLTWRGVAAVIRGGNSADSVKMKCYRYLDSDRKGQMTDPP